MLNLKKINLQQKLTSNSIDEEDTTFVEETIIQDQLINIIQEKPVNTLFSISELLSQPEYHTSISASQFTQILIQSTSESNLTSESQVNLALNILETLISIPHDPKEVKSHIKKEKLINPTFILAFIWEKRQNNKVWKYVDYMIECFPTEIILNGKEHIRKWEQFFIEYQEKIQQSEKINQTIKEHELKQKIKKEISNNKEKGFVDTYIFL